MDRHGHQQKSEANFQGKEVKEVEINKDEDTRVTSVFSYVK
jgi:hypothetical protein